MTVPTDVPVNRQVLAEPDATLTERTWATLARRHAAGHRATAGQGPDRPLPCHRRYALVGSAAFGHLRRDAQADRGLRRLDRGADGKPRQNARAREVCRRSRVLDGFGLFGAPPPRRGRCRNFAARATADHPPGFYGPPEGRLAVNTLDARRSSCTARRLRAQCAPGGLPNERTARSARADPARARSRCLRSTPWSCSCSPAGLRAVLGARPPPAGGALALRRSRRGLLTPAPPGLSPQNQPTSRRSKSDARDPARLCDHRRCRDRPRSARPACQA